MSMRQWLIDELADLHANEPATGKVFEVRWGEDGFQAFCNGREIDVPLCDSGLLSRRSVGWFEGRRQYFFAYTILLMASKPDLAHWFALRFADELFGHVQPLACMTFDESFVRAWLVAQLDSVKYRDSVLHIEPQDGSAVDVAF